MSKFAENVGADGLLLVTPYYNKCTQEGLYLHFKEIASSTTLPIILYNVPSRTCVNILPKTVARLSKIDNIVGIKEASSDISQITQIASLTKNSNFDIYSGNDDQVLPILSIGGVGVISVLANIYPNEVHEMCNSYFNDDIEKSRKLQLELLDIAKSLFLEVNPIPIKEAMNILKFNVGACRLPLTPMDKSNIEILQKSIENFNLACKKNI